MQSTKNNKKTQLQLLARTQRPYLSATGIMDDEDNELSQSQPSFSAEPGVVKPKTLSELVHDSLDTIK